MGRAAPAGGISTMQAVRTIAAPIVVGASAVATGRQGRSSTLHRTRARTCTAHFDSRVLALQPPLLLPRAASFALTPPATHMGRSAPSPQVISPPSRRHGAATTQRESAAAGAETPNMARFYAVAGVYGPLARAARCVRARPGYLGHVGPPRVRARPPRSCAEGAARRFWARLQAACRRRAREACLKCPGCPGAVPGGLWLA